jgi:hypothetical protein
MGAVACAQCARAGAYQSCAEATEGATSTPTMQATTSAKRKLIATLGYPPTEASLLELADRLEEAAGD